MGNSLYICGTDHQAGMSIITLGMYKALHQFTPNLTYFKPVSDGSIDQDVSVIKTAHNLKQKDSDICPVSKEEASRLLAHRQEEELLDRIKNSFQDMSENGNFVIVEGISSKHNLLDIDFNKNIASRLNIPVLLVARGDNCDTPAGMDELVTTVFTAKQVFEKEGLHVLGVLINRAVCESPSEHYPLIRKALKEAGVEVFGIIPELKSLSFPILDQIAQELKAQVISGYDALSETVAHVLVAAMAPRHFLRHLKKKKTLVITSGDRNDILLSIACTHGCPEHRKVAGVLLSGGIDPDPGVLELINAMNLPPLPILKVDTDSFITATHVQRVDVRIRPKDHEKIATASSRVSEAIDAEALWKALNIPLPKRKRSASVDFLEQLVDQARSYGNRIVLPEGEEPRTLKAVAKVQDLKLCYVTLLGDTDRITNMAKSIGVSFNEMTTVLDPKASPHLEEYIHTVMEARKGKKGGMTEDVAREWLLESTVNFGTVMVKLDHADGLVSGAIHSTADTIRPALQMIRVKQGVDVASSIFFMALQDRVLVYGDCAIVPNPNANELAAIAISSARTARAFGIEPRVALLSYSTGISGKGETVDKVSKALEIVKETNPDFAIDGPLQYDAAIDPDVGSLKLPDSPVAGTANVFIFPDLNAGNIAYKAVQRSAGALAVGPVLQGLNKPVNDLSRGCSVDDIVYTVAVTAIQAATDSNVVQMDFAI